MQSKLTVALTQPPTPVPHQSIRVHDNTHIIGQSNPPPPTNDACLFPDPSTPSPGPADRTYVVSEGDPTPFGDLSDSSCHEDKMMPEVESSGHNWLTNPDTECPSLLSEESADASLISHLPGMAVPSPAVSQELAPVPHPVNPPAAWTSHPMVQPVTNMTTFSSKLTSLKAPTPVATSAAPFLIKTPEMVLLDTTLQNQTISPSTTSDLLCSGEQSRLEPVSMSGADKSIRVVSPLTLGRFVNFANADKSLNLGVQYALQQQQQQVEEEEEEQTESSEVERLTLSIREQTCEQQQEHEGEDQEEKMKQEEETNQEYEEKGSGQEQHEQQEEEQQHNHAHEEAVPVQVEKAGQKSDTPCKEIPQPATQASETGRSLVEHLEELHDK